MRSHKNKMNCPLPPRMFFCRALLGLIMVSGLLFADKSAQANKLQTYWTTNPAVAETTPKEDGSNGWNKSNIATVPGQPDSNGDRCVWFAWRNAHIATNKKWFHLTFNRLNNENFAVAKPQAFVGENVQNPLPPENITELKLLDGNPEVHIFTFSPQPSWERIKIDNEEPGNSNWTLQSDAWSYCGDVRSENNRNVLIQNGRIGALGAMEFNNCRTTELIFFSLYTPIDTSATPTFTADPQTGNWSFEYVNVDPFGNPRPEGGIKWTTDGQGLLTGDAFDSTIELQDVTSGAISMFAFDDATGTYYDWDLVDFSTPFIDRFDIYDPFEGVIGWRGWSGFNDDPNLDALVIPQIFLSPPNSLEIQQNADVVRPFDGVDAGQWHFSTWTFIPGGYQGASTFFLFDEYQHNGPQHPGLLGQFDSNFGQLMFLCGDPNPIQVPYLVDQWVPIDIVVDLDADFCQVFYDQQPICEYQWTAGAFGDGNGQPQIAAIDLWANGSAPIFYDDMQLAPILPPILGDVNGDGTVNLLDVAPFVEAVAFGTFSPEADVNQDGAVNLLDVDPFIALLSG